MTRRVVGRALLALAALGGIALMAMVGAALVMAYGAGVVVGVALDRVLVDEEHDVRDEADPRRKPAPPTDEHSAPRVLASLPIRADGSGPDRDPVTSPI
jgi:hypothetical protein